VLFVVFVTLVVGQQGFELGTLGLKVRGTPYQHLPRKPFV